MTNVIKLFLPAADNTIGVLHFFGETMSYLAQSIGNIVIVKVLHTEATLKYAMDFRNYLTDLISKGNNRIIVDLTSTTFMDSTFLGVLVYMLKKSAAAGGDLRIIRNSGDSPVWKMFEITNMIKVFKIYGHSSEAIKSFAL